MNLYKLGSPYYSIDLFEENNIFDSIRDSLSKYYIVTACCSKEKKLQGKFESIGLLPPYSYTILSCKEFFHQGKQEQLLEIRNPWGWFGNEWKGKWSQDWYGWTKELRKDLETSEGSFLMDFNDFLDLFSTVTINKVHDNYHYTSDTFRHKPEAFSIRKLIIKDQISHCFLGLAQYDRRYSDNKFIYQIY